MLVSPRSDAGGVAASVEGTSNRSACDRCRGQKLRCIRDNNIQASCRRCERARTLCIISPTMRMGRPARAESLRVQKRSTKRRHARTSNSLSAPSDSVQNHPSLYADEHHQKNRRSTTSGAEDTSDLDIGESMNWLYPSSLSLTGPTLASDDFDIFESTHFQDSNQFSTITTPPISLNCDPPHTLFEPDRMAYSARDISFRDEHFGGRPAAPDTTSTKEVEHTTIKNTPDSSQKTFEQLSQLNVELHRQLVLEDTEPNSVSELCTTSSNESEPTAPLPVAVMIRGLNKFQELLQSYEKTGSGAFTGSSEYEQAHTRQPDFATSLLMISCYLNLIRLCHSVIYNLRLYLLAVDHQTIFARLPEFQISGVPLQQNTNIQILVLLQLVVSMLDNIGDSLGFKAYCSFSDRQRGEEVLPKVILMPKKLMFLLFKDEESETWSVSGSGIRALKEEIQKLKEVLDRM